MSHTPNPGDHARSLPDDIALAAGMPRGHQTQTSLHETTPLSDKTLAAGAEARAQVKEAAGGVAETASSLRDKAAETAGDLRDRATDAVGDLRARATDTAQDLRTRASGAYDDAQGWVSDARDTGRRHVEDLSQRGSERLNEGKSAVEDFVSENPLLVGVVGLAAGLLIGALLPRTRSEDRAVGPWADEIRGQGLRYARDVTSRGREFVASALDPDNLNAAVQRTGDAPHAPRAEAPVPPTASTTKPH